MTKEELRERSLQFAVRTVAMCRLWPDTWEARAIGRQLIASATSMAINYRACGRSRSPREFVAKIGIVVEEADETVGWYDMVERLKLASGPTLADLRREAAELLAIFAAAHLTARRNYERKTSRERT